MRTPRSCTSGAPEGWLARERTRGSDHRRAPRRRTARHHGAPPRDRAARAHHRTLSPPTTWRRVSHDAHPEIHLSTVYRTLDSLHEWGLVEHVHRPHGPSFFHLAGAHRHLVCEQCGRIHDVPAAEFDALVDAHTGPVRVRAPRRSRGAGRPVPGPPPCVIRERGTHAHPRRLSQPADVRRVGRGDGSVLDDCREARAQGREEPLRPAARDRRGVLLPGDDVQRADPRRHDRARGGRCAGGRAAGALGRGRGRELRVRRSRRCSSATAACSPSAPTASTWRWSCPWSVTASIWC